MSRQASPRIITTTWGHPNATYSCVDGPQVAKIYYTPASFEEFHGHLIGKGFTDRFLLDKSTANPTGIIRYLDDEGDWITIGSQTEYEEALVHIRNTDKPVPLRIAITFDESCDQKLRFKTGACTKVKVKNTDKSLQKLQKDAAGSSKLSSKKHARAVPTTFECAMVSEKLKHLNSSSPPTWFDSYMKQFKRELLTDIACMLEKQEANVADCNETSAKGVVDANVDSLVTKPSLIEAATVEAPLQDLDQNRLKLLRKKSKVHGSEKKLKKLNIKLEQLELKRSRLLEWNRKHQEQGLNPVPTTSTSNSVYDASVLGIMSANASIRNVLNVEHNAMFVAKWKVQNCGSAPWTDKTELRLAFITQGLKTLESTVKCPPLEPGQEGEIVIPFQAPAFAGVFESYWHFYNDEERFGQWMGCVVQVDPKPSESSKDTSVYSNVTNEQHLENENVSGVGATLSAAATAAGGDHEEYESDPDDNNGSDSDATEDSASFVHVPMPPCYQFDQLLNIQSHEEEEASVEKNDLNVERKPTLTPPTTPREPDSEDDLYVEASEAGSNAENVTSSTKEQKPSTNNQNEGARQNLGPVHILPESIVAGAINVATRAVNATEAIMKSFQYSQQKLVTPPGAPTADTYAPPQQEGANDHVLYNFPPPQHPAPMIPVPAPMPIPPTTLPSQQPPQMATAFNQMPFQYAIPLPAPPGMVQPPIFPEQAFMNQSPSTNQGPIHYPRLPSHVSPDSPYLQMLYDMGFTNTRLNTVLLKKHSNNVSEVVAELLSMQQDN